MQVLRPDQVERAEAHRERAFDVLVAAAAHYDGLLELSDYPAGKALLEQQRDFLVSVVVSAAVAAVERRSILGGLADSVGLIRIGAADVFPAVVLDKLKRRKLPYLSADAELLLDLGTSSLQADSIFARSYETIACALSAAAIVLENKPGSAPVMMALERLVAAIEAQDVMPGSRPGKLRQKAKSLIAAHVPGGIPDLSVIDPRDDWAPRAGAVLRHHAERWDSVHEFLALATSARGTRPTQAWRRRASGLVAEYGDMGTVLRDLLEPVLDIDIVKSGVPWPPVWLLAPDNEILIKGAAWMLVEIDETWVVPLLGQLALRGAAASPHPKVTTALARTVAGSAIEVLALIGTPAAHDELDRLIGEIRRRDLLKRIAAIVGEDSATTQDRDDRIRREKQRESRRR